MARVYSHPRSGTSLLAETLAMNFYPGADLSTPGGPFGHWNGRVTVPGHPRGKLVGGHRFYSPVLHTNGGELYVHRDGRDVALSIWRTAAFINPAWSGISLSDFLRVPIDWSGSPGARCAPVQTIALHWASHVWSWMSASKRALMVRYEDLLECPTRELDRMSKYLDMPHRGRVVGRPVGQFPNDAVAGRWMDFFSGADDEFFRKRSGAMLDIIKEMR